MIIAPDQKYLIFWTNQEDAEQIERGDMAFGCPAYLKRQLSSRYGRAGRGRLWIDDLLTTAPAEIPWDDASPVCRRAADCAGIVIRAEDTSELKSSATGTAWPGFLTDTAMNLVSP